MKSQGQKSRNITAGKDLSLTKNYFEKNTNFYLVLIVITTFLIFSPCLKNGFLIYDDVENVTDNVHITSFSLQHIKTFFTLPLLYMYTPFVYISFAIDYKISGLNPVIFHLSNLLLHLLNVLLVFLFVKLLTKKKETAFITAVLFAVHPVMADTVAWISARSNLLFTFFFLSSLIAYLHCLENNFRLKFYFFSLLLFLFSCLSKSAAIVLPFALLLIDYFKGRKFQVKIIAEKTPFFLVSIAAAAITLYVRTDASASHTSFTYSLSDKFFILCYSCFAYPMRFVLPINLSAVYSYPAKINGTLPLLFYAAPFAFFIATVIITSIKKNRKEICWGVLFFLLNIVISLAGFLEDGFSANRYAYLPSVGLFFIIGNFYSVLNTKKNYLILVSAFVIASGILSYHRAGIWKNNLSLFNDIIDKQPDHAFAYNLKGIAQYDLKEYAFAVDDYSRAIELNKNYPEAFYNRAISRYALGEFSKSMEDYSEAIALNPESAKSYVGRGIIKMNVLKEYNNAIDDFDKALQLDPFMPQAYYNRGLAKLRTEKTTAACKDFRRVKQLGYSQADELIQKYCN